MIARQPPVPNFTIFCSSYVEECPRRVFPAPAFVADFLPAYNNTIGLNNGYLTFTYLQEDKQGNNCTDSKD